ncbi:MAG: hypothetical protein K2Z81_09895 [Cyanobacteria bacterium]|nr:hypothetical protein [Cyanobacteriota bacterium]
MQSFEFGPVAATVILTVVIFGAFGLVVLFPVVLLQWGWNVAIAPWAALPLIELWQAALLYVAAALMIYLAGLVKIEIKLERFE